MAPLPSFHRLSQGFDPLIFQNTDSIIQMHTIPRITDQTEMSVLLTGSPQQQKDYLMGVIVYVGCTFSLFVIWTLLLIVFKCCGSKRVGFCSGRVPRRPILPTDSEFPAIRVFEQELKLYEEVIILRDRTTDRENCAATEPQDQNDTSDSQRSISPSHLYEIDDDGKPLAESDLESKKSCAGSPDNPEDCEKALEQYNGAMKRIDRLLFRTRIVAVLSGIGAIVSSTLFFYQGIFKIGTALNTGVVGLEGVERILNEAIDITDQLLDIRLNTTGLLVELNATLVNVDFCPLRRDVILESCIAVVENVTAKNGTANRTVCDISGMDLGNQLATLVEILHHIPETLAAEIAALQSDLRGTLSITDQVIRQIRSFYWAFQVSTAFGVLVDVIIIVLLCGVFFAWRRREINPFIWLQSYCIIPLFIFFLFLMWLFAIIFCLSAIFTADFCVDGPDKRLLSILQQMKASFSSQVFRLIESYLAACLEQSGQIVATELETVIINGIRFVHDVAYNTSQLDEEEYYEICGVNISLLEQLMESIHVAMHALADFVLSVQEFFMCNNIFPALGDIFFNATCYMGVDAFRFVFIALFCTLTFSLILITVRVAWQVESHRILDEQSKTCCRSLVRMCRGRKNENQQGLEMDSCRPVTECSVREDDNVDGKDENDTVVNHANETKNSVIQMQPAESTSTFQRVYLLLLKTFFLPWLGAFLGFSTSPLNVSSSPSS